MHINPSHLPIGGLLGGGMTFQVPRYQRNYAWGTEEIAAFLKDLALCHQARVRAQGPKAERRHHFFGGIVTARSPVQGSTRHNLELIDGQQRLATFLMLVVQLKRAMRQLAIDLGGTGLSATFLNESADLLCDRYETYRDTINLEVVSVPRLQLSLPDQQFMAELLDGRVPKPERRSHELLKEAFDAIGEHLKGIVDAAADKAARVRALDLVHEVFEQDWTVIHMAAEARTDAHMLFQVLNDRGVSLTEGELLRASTLEALEPIAPRIQMQVIEKRWDDILKGKASDIREALWWIHASHVGTAPSRAALQADVQSALFPMLGTGVPLSRDDAEPLGKVVESLHRDFATLEHILQGEWPCVAHQSIFAWDRDRLRLLVVHLKQTDCVPLLIAASLLTPAKFADIVQVLERFCFRYTIMVEARRKDAIDVFNEHAVEIRKNPTTFNTRPLFDNLRNLLVLHAPDDVFASRLEELRYQRSESKKPLKYFLMTLEHYVRWFDEGAQGRPTCRDRGRVFDFENGTIEHIYAENSEQPDPSLEPLLDTLGNLTFLSPAENDAVGAKGFAQKQPYLQASTTTLNKQIAVERDWTAAVVLQRQRRLIDMALRVFTL